MEEALVLYLAKNLVDTPDEVVINKREAGRTIVLELRVAQDDMGRVIGRNGRVANAIRSLMRAVGDMEQSNQRVILEIE